MKVGIIGSGAVGRTLGAGFAKHGHQVMLGSRDPGKDEIMQWVSTAAGASCGTFEQATRFGEIIVLCTLGSAAISAIELAGPANFAGKTVIDTTNPISDKPPIDGVLSFTTGPNESLGEAVQAKLPDARVVKAFNSVGSTQMVDPHYEQGVPTMFYCGEDTRAKDQAAEIIRQFGWEPFDCGGIIAARALEPLCMLWCIPGFLRNQWTHAFKLLTH